MTQERRFISLLLALAGVVTFTARAQFYAPQSDYHDPVQRVFPVEAARVLAWIGGPTNLSQIAYSITNRSGETVWDLRWQDSAGKAIKSATIAYPAARLKEGAEFYRTTFKHLWALDWGPSPTLQPEDCPRLFWQGARRIKLSREASLAELTRLAAAAEPKTAKEKAAELAGLLVHTSLPGLADRVTLDGVLVARGAAWLAFSEQGCGKKFDALWAPVLFQAGRDLVAESLWTNSSTALPASATTPELGWDILLRRPTSRNIFTFATQPENLTMAMPMLGWDGWVNRTTGFLGEVIEQLVGDRRRLTALHNYAPMFAYRSSIGGGHLLDGAWAKFSREAWIDLLSSYEPAPGDFHGYSQALKSTQEALKRNADKTGEEQDGCLAGFKECAPLLRLARQAGEGPLIPTGTVTAADLLNYGWEMAGLQLGGRYNFVQVRWGIREQARPILQLATTQVPGWMPFFLSTRYARNPDYVDSLRRLQMLDGFFHRVGFNPHPFTQGASQNVEAVRLWLRRSWLRPLDFEWMARTLWDTALPEIFPLIDALRDQQGALASAQLLIYLTALNDEAMRRIPDPTNLLSSIAQRLPQPSQFYVRAVYPKKFAPLDDFMRGQEMERLYWRAPESGIESQVMMNYLYAGAYDSAVRYYKQFRRNLTDPVQFSQEIGKSAWVLGYITGNKDVRRMALEDSRSGSGADMTLNMWEAAANDDSDALKQQIDERILRYDAGRGPDSLGERLARFMPLLPALREPKHPQRDAALDYFGQGETAMLLRWIWINEYKLPTEDAIRLLGGRQTTNYLSRVMVCSLEKERKKLDEAVTVLEEKGVWRGEDMTIARHLMFQLDKDRKAPADADLRPAGARSLSELLKEKLEPGRN